MDLGEHRLKDLGRPERIFLAEELTAALGDELDRALSAWRRAGSS